MDRSNRIHKLWERNRREASPFFDMPDGQQRPQHVEVFLQPHLFFEQVLACVSARHVALVIGQRFCVKCAGRELAQSFGNRPDLDVSERAAKPFEKSAVRSCEQVQRFPDELDLRTIDNPFFVAGQGYRRAPLLRLAKTARKCCAPPATTRAKYQALRAAGVIG